MSEENNMVYNCHKNNCKYSFCNFFLHKTWQSLARICNTIKIELYVILFHKCSRYKRKNWQKKEKNNKLIIVFFLQFILLILDKRILVYYQFGQMRRYFLSSWKFHSRIIIWRKKKKSLVKDILKKDLKKESDEEIF